MECNKNGLESTEKSVAEGRFAHVVPIVVIAFWLVFYLGLGAYFYIAESVIPKKQYAQATELLAERRYEEAYELLSQNKDYRDGQEKCADVEVLLAAEAHVGDTILFGNYDKKSHGREDALEWIVLAKQEDRMLVISKEILGTMNFGRIEGEGAIDYATRRLPYVMEDDDEHAADTWGASPMRGYLHRELSGKILNPMQVSKLIETIHTDRDNASAKDTLFLLSADEAKRYFTTDDDRQLGDGWWLRTAGEESDEFCYVNDKGEVCEGADGKTVGEYFGVRPAMWINIAAEG